MVSHQGRLKSRTLRRVHVRVTKGNRIHYKKRNRSSSLCAITKRPLSGLPRLTNKQFGKLNKSQKTISRPYGGYMSHTALKNKILDEIVLKEE